MRRLVGRRLALFISVLALVLFVGAAVWALKAGDKAPDFTTKDLNGKKVKLSQCSGKPVVLYFWATW